MFRLLDREVWIVTAATETHRGGLVATWISQSSIDKQRPTVTAGIAPNHFTSELIDASGAFALHLIEERQIELVGNFAVGSGRDRDKLDTIKTTIAVTGSPVLSDCLAWLDCRVAARIDVGERILYLADVVAGEVRGLGKPLTEQAMINLADKELKQQLLADRDRDVELQRPFADQWRAQIPENLQTAIPRT